MTEKRDFQPLLVPPLPKGVIPNPNAKAVIVDDIRGHRIIAAFYKAPDIVNQPYCTECREPVVRWGNEWSHV